MTAYQKTLLGLFMALFVWLSVGPADRVIWLAENSGVIVFLPVLAALAVRKKLSSAAYTMLLVFFALHAVGAHYTYDKVPFGETLGRWIGSERNVYDQFVHFAFGLLSAYPLHEYFTRTWNARKRFGYAVPFIVIMSLAGIYEVLEWLVAFALRPVESAGFLGSGGDYWDTQKDMAAAGVGAFLALLATYFAKRK